MLIPIQAQKHLPRATIGNTPYFIRRIEKTGRARFGKVSGGCERAHSGLHMQRNDHSPSHAYRSSLHALPFIPQGRRPCMTPTTGLRTLPFPRSDARQRPLIILPIYQRLHTRDDADQRYTNTHRLRRSTYLYLKILMTAVTTL